VPSYDSPSQYSRSNSTAFITGCFFLEKTKL
jgi:hypothetical protein